MVGFTCESKAVRDLVHILYHSPRLVAQLCLWLDFPASVDLQGQADRAVLVVPVSLQFTELGYYH